MYGSRVVISIAMPAEVQDKLYAAHQRYGQDTAKSSKQYNILAKVEINYRKETRFI